MTILEKYGYKGQTEEKDGFVPGRVVEIQRELYHVVCELGETDAVLTGSFIHGALERSDYPAVGDFVLIKHNPSGNSGIGALLPRSSKFSRTDFSGHAAGYVKTVKEQVVAANFDYVFVVTSLNQDFNVNRVARYLTLAKQSGGKPAVILTKADLCTEPGEYVERIAAMAPDVETMVLSSRTGVGITAMEPYLEPGKTMVFLGMSGVGKSSLLNALAGEELMSVKEIRQDDARGRHTTTHRQLFMLPSGAMVIDTPGMREIGLWNAEKGISASFADIEELVSQCRFSDCAHRSEPGCAIKRAIEEGSLSKERWDEYRKQRMESNFVKKRTKPLLTNNGRWIKR